MNEYGKIRLHHSKIVKAQTDSLKPGITVPDHPRLLMLAGEEAAIKKVIGADHTWEGLNQALLSECDSIIAAPLLERIQIGRRLLGVSREALRRIFYLSYAWRMTNEKKYLEKIFNTLILNITINYKVIFEELWERKM